MKIKIHHQGLKRALPVMSVIAAAASAWAAPCPGTVSDFDAMRAPLLPTGWVASQGVNVTGAPLWVTTRVTPDTAPNEAFSTAPDNILDNRLDTPVLTGGPPFFVQIFFKNNYNLESGADGAVLEVSHPAINGGAFTDITDPAVGGSVSPGYNALITSASSPIAGRMAWTGNSGGYISTVADLGNAFPPSGGCKVRFRLVSDNSVASAGWRIDTVAVSQFECFPTPTPTPPAATPSPIPSPCGSPNVIADSTFEAGTPWSDWTVQTSTNFGTPLCNGAVCGTQGGSPYGGDNWVWFGGANVPETATLGQNVTILAGGPATLSFVMRNRSVIHDVLNVRVDGMIVQSYPGGQFEGAYSMRAIDLSAFADGGSHLILFEYVAPTTETSTYLVDNVFLTFGPACSSPTPSPSPTPTTTPAATPSPSASPGGSPCPDLIVDGGFETGGIPNTFWNPETSTNFGTPLCDVPSCGTGGGASPPRTGGFWLWFGGVPAPETATLGQTVFIQGGPTFTTLRFWMRVGTVSSPFTDVVNVRVDGAIIQSFPEPTVAEGAYTERVIDLTAFNGASHALLFEYIGPSSGAGSFLIDDVSVTQGICAAIPTPSATPTATPSATPPPTPTPTPSPTATPLPVPTQAMNISTRLRVETGDRIMIGGFIITGSAPKRVALRGLGPSLSNSGLTGLMADPTLELRGSDGALLLQNDNWQDDAFGGKQLAALGLAPQHPNESGMVATLPPGAYTALMAGKNQTSGIGLVEIYDTDTGAASQLANISTRGFVQAGDNVMIGGFILGHGSGSADVVVRGIGPSLSQFGLSNVLADPTLELRDGNGALLVANDNWQDDPVSAGQLTARGLAPTNALESGIFASLPPGAATSILAGKNGGMGIGLIEVYNTSVTAVPTPTPTATATSTPTVAPIIVNSTADNGAGSLRDAIAAASDGDTIQFGPALNGQTITLTSAELVIDTNITISGPGPNQLTVQRSTATGAPAFRIFHVTPGHTVAIRGLTITHGVNSLVSGGGAVGGGVFNDHAALTLDNCIVTANGGEFGNEGAGGGIYNRGENGSATLTLVNSTVSENFAGNGGGILNDGALLVITNSFITHNSVSIFTGGFANLGSGAGVYNTGTLEIANSTVNNNIAYRDGGGIFSTGPLTITDSIVTGNNAGPTEGGGGGIVNGGSATITNSILSQNWAGASHDGFGLGYGGAISNGGTLEIVNSTLSGNGASSSGGAISNGGNGATLAIINSTISGNSATIGWLGDSHGGAISNSGTLDIASSTVHGNTADLGGGIYNHATLRLGNTILNVNIAGSIINDSGTGNSRGYNLSSDGGSGVLTATGDQINTDPLLGSLQNNGGSTFTHALLTGSPAINAGDPNFTSPHLYDQRGPGYPRVIGGRIDVGSFEL